jgi:hypothetical protein
VVVVVLLPLEPPPLGLGAATTGAGALVVTGGADCVVTGGACVVVALVVTGLGFCTALWCTGFLGLVAGSVVVV